jgi:hypothetical protein
MDYPLMPTPLGFIATPGKAPAELAADVPFSDVPLM